LAGGPPHLVEPRHQHRRRRLEGTVAILHDQPLLKGLAGRNCCNRGTSIDCSGYGFADQCVALEPAAEGRQAVIVPQGREPRVSSLRPPWGAEPGIPAVSMVPRERGPEGRAPGLASGIAWGFSAVGCRERNRP
jgi:hypothetical protein